MAPKAFILLAIALGCVVGLAQQVTAITHVYTFFSAAFLGLFIRHKLIFGWLFLVVAWWGPGVFTECVVMSPLWVSVWLVECLLLY